MDHQVHGKTSIAEVIANITKYKFYKINAVTSGVSDIKKIIEESENIFLNPEGKSILFIDEIHRFNKAQQDILLPYIEKGTLILIGATTENPYYEINKAVISRSMVYKLNDLNEENIIEILKRAITDKNGLGSLEIDVKEEALEIISKYCDGDIRAALNILEQSVLCAIIGENGKINLNRESVLECLGEKKQYYDKASNEHYNNISALIKSVRGSDADAALHYLAKALVSGEDIKFLARRLVILSAEDIGLANPNALNIAVSGMNAVEKIGMPESRIILAEVAVYLAKSKKSNSAYMGINMAMEDVRTIDTGEIPIYLTNPKLEELANLKVKERYKYPHDYKDGKACQRYLPEKIKDKKYYIDKWENDKYE